MSKHINAHTFIEFLADAEEQRKNGLSERVICKNLAEKYGSSPDTLRRRWVRSKASKVAKKQHKSSKNKYKNKGKQGIFY